MLDIDEIRELAGKIYDGDKEDVDDVVLANEVLSLLGSLNEPKREFDVLCNIVRPINHIEAWGTKYPVKQGTFAGHDHLDMELDSMSDVRLLFSPAFVGEEELRGWEVATIVREDGTREKVTAKEAWAELLLYQECSNQMWKNIERR